MIYKSKYTTRVFRYFLFGIVASLLSAIIMQYFFSQFNFQETFDFVFYSHTKLFLYGAGILFAMYVWLTALTGSSVLGSSLLTTFSLLISLTSYVKFQYRNEPLYPNELSMVTNFSEILTMINALDILITLGSIFVLSLLTYILYKSYSIKNKNPLSKTVHYSWRITTLIFSSLLLFYVGQFNNSNNLIKELYSVNAKWITYDQNKNYNQNGFIAGFLYNLGTIYMEEPEGYSQVKMEEIYKKYFHLSETINEYRDNNTIDTNIVYIMNESFSDPLKINGFTTDKDPIPYTRELMENTLSGESLSLNIGGGTANSEFEALTSFSKEPLQVYAPYVEAVDAMHKVPTIAKKANEDNMLSTAIHPYDPTLYKRLSVYDSFGFSHFIHEDTMKYTEKLGKSWHISDVSAYKESMDVIDESNEKDFIHIVTMQNHIPYGNKYENFSFNTSGADIKSEGDGYMEELYNSDKAIKEFIEYVDNHQEEFIVVFWGDHLPGIYSDEVFEKNDDLTMRETPLFFYSNKHDLSGDVGTISPIYYLNYILEILDIKVSPYEALLSKMEKQIPGLNGGLYIESHRKGSISSREDLSEETLQVLEDFILVQYDIIAGKQYAKEIGFFEQFSN